MTKNFYLIPGMGQNCNLLRYKKLEKAVKQKGYNVFLINPQWDQPISSQVFQPEKNSVIFGFSMGAVLAYLVGKKFGAKKLILASMSPINEFDFDDFEKFLETKMSKDKVEVIVSDLKKIKIKLEKIKASHVTLAGEREGLRADIIISRATHFISDSYREEIVKLI